MLYLKRFLLKNTQFLRLPQYSTNSLLSMKEQKYYSDSKVPFPTRNKGKKQYHKKQDNSQIHRKPAQHNLNDYLKTEKSKLQVNNLIEKLIKRSEMGKTSRATTFEEEITLRRDQAHRTILFKIKDSGTLPDQLVHVLLSMCVSLTNVSLIGNSALNYTRSSSDDYSNNNELLNLRNLTESICSHRIQVSSVCTKSVGKHK